MKTASKFKIILVTAPDLKVARKLADSALKEKLVACANLVPGIESHYWWQGKIESSPEVLMLMKTTAKNLSALEKLIVSNHPYDTPAILAVPINAGNEKYLKWLKASMTQ